MVVLTPVDGGVADVLALHEVDNVLGDVGGMVADALEVLGHEDQLKRGKDHARIAHHIGQQFTKNIWSRVIGYSRSRNGSKNKIQRPYLESV